eukprot:gene16198-22360_t
MAQEAELSVALILKSFEAVQHQRANHYARLHESFERFLESRQEGIHQQTLQELTVAFNDCSKRILDLMDLLRSHNRLDLVDLFRGVQEHERDKFKLELSLLALRQAHAFEVFSWQHEDEGIEGAGGCSHEHHATCAHAHHGASPQGALAVGEATKAEFDAAVLEATLAIDKTVLDINGILDEVKQALMEEEEEEE